MPEISMSEIFANMMIAFGDIFTVIGLIIAILALLFAILGMVSPKIRQQKEHIRFGGGAFVILFFLAGMFISKLMTEELVDYEIGLFFGFSNFLFIVLWLGIALLLVLTALIAVSGNTKS